MLSNLELSNFKKNFIVIDIGSNSIKSTFYQVDFTKHEIVKFPFYRRLFKLLNHFKDGHLGENIIYKIIEDFNLILEFLKNNKIFEKIKIYCFATEVLRRANNYAYIQMIIYRQTGIYIDILCGGREGYILYLAFLNFYLPNHPPKKRTYGLLDYGGGSCEVVICDNENIKEIKSLKIGSLVLLNQNLLANTNLINWTRIQQEIFINLEKIETKPELLNQSKFFSASASLKSINFLMTKVFYKKLIQINPNAVIKKNNLKSMILLQKFIMQTNNKVLQQHHVLKIGYNSIRCALFAFTSFYHKYKINEITAITCSVRDGYLAMLFESFPEMKKSLKSNNFQKWNIKNARITRGRSS